REALDIYTKQSNELGMAEAHHAFGNFYKNGLYHTKWAPVYKRMGTYDGTYMKSVDNFSTAKRLFEKNENNVGVMKSLVGLGNAYELRGEKDKACENYNAALRSWEAAKQKDPSVRAPILTGYRNPEELINAFRQKWRCE